MNSIVIMAKAPVPNEVKTRLTPSLRPEEASSLYHCFLLDKIEQIKSIGEVGSFVAYMPAAAEAFFKNIIPPGFSLISQVGTDLGERLANVSKRLFAQGERKVVILDSDTPNLPTDYILEGFSRLDKADVVLGPCEDGGYYLIGMRKFVPEIFNGIPWSTSEVKELTIRKAQALDLTVSLLPEWYDVDTVMDLRRLMSDLDSPSGNCYFCRNTFTAISFLIFE